MTQKPARDWIGNPPASTSPAAKRNTDMPMRKGSIPDFEDYAGKGIDQLHASLGLPRPYQCKCGASFTSTSGLTYHLKLHAPHPDHEDISKAEDR